VHALVAAGDTVVVLDNMLTGRLENLAPHLGGPALTVVIADAIEALPDALTARGFDDIYHLASPASPAAYARHPIETLMVNSTGTHRLLELARTNGARFLFASTSEVYGDPDVHPQVETYWGNVNPIGPRACYDEGKRFGESLVVHYARLFDVDARVARIFNTYGPRSDPADGRMIPNFCVQALLGQPLTVYGDGTQTRSLCYVDDLARGLRALMNEPSARHEVINLGSPEEHDVLTIARMIVAVTGERSPIEYRPLPQDDPRRRRPDIAKARRMLGWAPTTPLAEGLDQTLAYFRAELGVVA